MSFRISIGSGECRNRSTGSAIVRNICESVMQKINLLRIMPPEKLRALKPVENEEVIGQKTISSTTYRTDLKDGTALIVVEAFFPTLVWPTYFSSHGIGKLFAEGLLVTQDGKIVDATSEMLWEYR